VQGELTEAIVKIAGERTTIHGAGRTDAGVHAFGQTAHFDIEKDIDPMKFIFGLNAVTSEDIAIKSLQEVDIDFDARRDAVSRIYTYRIHVGPTALQRRFVWQINYELDVERMNAAMPEIKGEHNFSAFCVQKSLKENNNCTVMDASWRKIGYEYLFTIEANRFLHGMVRLLVGSFSEIGKGKLTIEDFRRKIINGENSGYNLKVPARGLTLVKVRY
jgi:tRNA pseudouridine38-40 synthase